jgi:hypothetical protein
MAAFFVVLSIKILFIIFTKILEISIIFLLGIYTFLYYINNSKKNIYDKNDKSCILGTFEFLIDYTKYLQLFLLRKILDIY